MNFFILLSFVASVAMAAPQYSISEPSLAFDAPTARDAAAEVAVAAPQNGYVIPNPSPAYGTPSTRDAFVQAPEIIPILRDDRVNEDDGSYNFDVETANGIKAFESGSPDGPEGAIVALGQYSYTDPEGNLVEVTYIADANGFQPQSDVLPIAPEFPHEIPQFVLDQIQKAAEEDALAAAETRQEPSALYGAPQ